MSKRRLARIFLVGSASLGLLAVATVGGVYLYISPSLPSVSVLKDIRLQTPLRIYSRGGQLISIVGNKRRIPLDYWQIPPLQVEAFIAAEDDRFFAHPGLDMRSLARAAINLILTGQKSQGASTITMQVARNFFLTRRKLYIRKIREIFLALRIEHKLSKEDILRLYLNKIYLGNHAYGIGAAAEVYYGKGLWQLDLAQMAMLAGLPKAPSAFNPIANPKRALERRAYVLGRMHDLGFINTTAYDHAMAAPITAYFHGPEVKVHAPYVTAMVRNYMVKHYGKATYTAGFEVTTTISSRLEKDAHAAMTWNLERMAHEKTWRGPVAHVNLPLGSEHKPYGVILQQFPDVANLIPGIVEAEHKRSASVFVQNVGTIRLPWSALRWAAAGRTNAKAFLKRGDVLYLNHSNHTWTISEIPQVEGAIVALDPYDGAIVAIDGGYSFTLSQFNRATQAHRQLGSSFKPFVYSAALNDGLTLSTLISNAPLVAVANKELAEYWRPTNYERNTTGMVRLSEGLIHSINIVSVRILQRVSVQSEMDWIQRFGFDSTQIPHNLTLVLGSASLTPLQMARGYSVFANGGFLVRPYLIQRIYGPGQQLLAEARPWVACQRCKKRTNAVPTASIAHAAVASSAPVLPAQIATLSDSPTTASAALAASSESATTVVSTPSLMPRLAPRTISPQIAYLTTHMMQGVIQSGTGQAARAIGRHDLAGKTGTTNNYTDAWFDGYAPRLVAITWVGYDKQDRSLGPGQVGARAALPMWIHFMQQALKGSPDTAWPMPSGLVTVRIDSQTGLRCGPSDPHAMWEVFRSGHVPPWQSTKNAPTLYGGG